MVVFEDNEDDLLQVLIRKAYPKEISKDFVYAGGNGNLYDKTKEILNSCDEKVFVLLDSPPGNPSISKIYGSLADLAIETKNRVIVFNIVCAEYYFINAYRNSNIYKENYAIGDFNRQDIYFESGLYNASDKNKEFCKNYEKFCKLVTMVNFIDCAKHTRGEDNCNIQYGDFYKLNCLCGNNAKGCEEDSLEVKALKYIKEYPFKPNGYLGDKEIMSESDITSKHRELVDEFNRVADIYNEYRNATGLGEKTRHIRYMV